MPRWAWKRFPFQPIPRELAKLSFIERSMIAPILAVVKLGRTYDGQLKVKNHAVSFVSKNFQVLKVLPRKPEDVYVHVHVNVKVDKESGEAIRIYNNQLSYFAI